MPIEKESSNNTPALLLLRERLSKFETEDGRRKGLSYQPRPNDVGICTAAKAGTTWMQQICHQIRAADVGGDMNFDEIGCVVPWIELAVDLGQDLEAEQYGEKEGKPRLFKTHLWYDHCPKFPKTVVVFRNPFDVAVSFYNFLSGWFFEHGAISLDLFVEHFWLARDIPENEMQNASYFVHLISWYQRRHDDSVLIVFFEDMKEDLAGQVRRVARFLSNENHNFDTPELIQVVVEHSSYHFMQTHSFHFDEKLTKLSRNVVCGMEKNAGMDATKIAHGKVGHGHSILTEDLKDKIAQKWNQVVEPVTSCATYNELRERLNLEMQQDSHQTFSDQEN